MPSAVEWLAALSPWPADGFGLERIRAVLAELGEPQLGYPSIHVVGTNGKSTATRTIEELLGRDGLRVGAFVSPHVERWSERIRVAGEEADLEQALAAVRPACERHGATQFEALTAAALRAFAGLDVAVVEAGLGGRHDATNVLRSPVQVLTNVSLEHTDVLGSTREAIAAEKLAVVQPDSTVVLGEPEWEEAARAAGAATVVVADNVARAAAEAFLGHAVEPMTVALAGRLERRGDEIRDGAHNPAGVAFLVERIEPVGAAVVSILADKDADAMLASLAGRTRTLVTTSSSSGRALSARELASRAERYFEHVEAVDEPTAALERGHALAAGGCVLVTGSLYLLADLADTHVRWPSAATG